MVLSPEPIAGRNDYQSDNDAGQSRPRNGDGHDKLHYLSNLRAFLTALVIFHHTAVFYGGAGNLATHSVSQSPNSKPVLVAFNALNQTFFMATFFFISSFLSRQSLERRIGKGDPEADFAMDRFWRLGVPTIVYSLFGPAVCRVIVVMGTGEGATNAWQALWTEIVAVRGVRGPVWFCALLLAFEALFAECWTLKRRDTPSSRGAPGANANDRLADDWVDVEDARKFGGLLLFGALVALTATDFLWRLILPVNTMAKPLNLNLGYLPQYVAAFTFGTLVPAPEAAVPSGRTFLVLAVVSSVSGVLLGRSTSDRLKGGSELAFGGYNGVAAMYAIWNNFTGYLIGAGLLHVFQHFVNMPGKVVTNLAYTVFLLHIPVSTLLEILLEQWQAGPVIKTAFVGLLNVVLTWAVAWIWKASTAVVCTGYAKSLGASRQTQSLACRKNRMQTLSRSEPHGEISEGIEKVKF